MGNSEEFADDAVVGYGGRCTFQSMRGWDGVRTVGCQAVLTGQGLLGGMSAEAELP